MAESVRRPFADIGQERASPRHVASKRTPPSSLKKSDAVVKAFSRKSPVRKKQRGESSQDSPGYNYRLTRSATKRMSLGEQLDDVVEKVRHNLHVDENTNSVNSPSVSSRQTTTGSYGTPEKEDDSTVSMEAFKAIFEDAKSDSGESRSELDSRFPESEEKARPDRRNTASPSMLRAMMELSDSEDEDANLEIAAQRGMEKAKTALDSRSSSIGYHLNNTPPKQTTREATSPQRNSLSQFSMVSPPANQVRYNPTPLKSCLSSRKARRPATSQKKSISFGSPKAAEFDLNDPVRGGVTPMRREEAKSRFRMEEPGEETQVEDETTAMNSSILSTWEEEEEEGYSSRSSSLGSSNGSGRRRSSTGSARRLSLRRSPRLSKTSQADDSSGDTADLGDLKQLMQEDSPASRRHRQRAPSNASDEDHTVELGSLQDLVAQAEMLSSGSSKGSRSSGRKASKSRMGFDSDDEGSEQDQTVELGRLSDLLASVEKRHARDSEDRTAAVGSLSELARMSSPGPIAAAAVKSFAEKTDQDDQGTVELGNLHSLARLSSPGPGTAAAENEDRTVELGNLSSLAEFSPEESHGESKARKSEDRTVELGELKQLADFSSPIAEQSDSRGGTTTDEVINSSSEESPQSKDSTSPNDIRCNMQAAFDNLLTVTPAADAGDSDEKVAANARLSMSSGGRLSLPSPTSHISLNSTRTSSFRRSSTGASKLDFSDVGDCSPEGNKAVSDSVTTSEAEHQAPESEDAIFQPTRVLPRSPTDDGVDALHCDESMEDGTACNTLESTTYRERLGEQHQSAETSEEADSQVPMPLGEFLKKTQVEFKPVPSGLESFVPQFTMVQHTVTEVSQLEPDVLKLYSQHLPNARAMIWACQEIFNSVQETSERIQNLQQEIATNPPSVLQTAGAIDEQSMGDLGDKMRSLKQMVELEVDMDWYQWRTKLCTGITEGLYLNMKAYSSDCETVAKLRENVEGEVSETVQACDAMKHLGSLLKAIEEQDQVIGGYQKESSDLEAAMRQLEDECVELDSKISQAGTKSREIESNAIIAAKTKPCDPELMEQLKHLEETVDAADVSLQVAKGLHIWQPVFTSESSIIFNFFNNAQWEDAEDCCRLEVELSNQTSTCEIQRITALTENSTDRFVFETLDQQLLAWREEWFTNAVKRIGSQFVGSPSSKLPHFLHTMDLGFGRYSALLTEVEQLISDGFPLKLTKPTGSDASSDILKLELVLVSMHLQAGIDVRISIKHGYPLVKDCCQWEIQTLNSEGATKVQSLVQHAKEAVKRADYAFQMLSRTCKSLVELVQNS